MVAQTLDMDEYIMIDKAMLSLEAFLLTLLAR